MARRARISTTSIPTPIQPPSSADEMIAHLASHITPALHDQPDLIAVPEWCDQPSEGSPESFIDFKQKHGETIRNWFVELARQHKTYIGYASITETAPGHWENTVEMLDRRGEPIGRYAKTCLTEPEANGGIHPGRGPVLIETDFGTVAPVICFDLNFNDLRQQFIEAQPDLILFASMYHGGPFQQIWALDCEAFFVAAVTNQPSVILSPLAQTLATTTNYTHHVTREVNLDAASVHLDNHADKLAAMKRELGRGVTISDPGRIGRVLVTAENQGDTIESLLERFEIELARDYLQRNNPYHHPINQ